MNCWVAVFPRRSAESGAKSTTPIASYARRSILGGSCTRTVFAAHPDARIATTSAAAFGHLPLRNELALIGNLLVLTLPPGSAMLARTPLGPKGTRCEVRAAFRSAVGATVG